MPYLTLFKHRFLHLNAKTAIAVSALFWVYLIFRAYLVPFLHDEISTFWFFINTGHYLPFAFHIDRESANNHVLNSFLSELFYKVFGPAPFVLRMANLLFVPVYCFFAYKIANTLKNKYLALLFWLCLLCIHSIVEFLALSRGYGMSFALLLGSLWFLVKTLKSHHILDDLLASLFLVAGVSANLSLITTALMILSLLMINVFLFKDKAGRKLLKLGIIGLAGVLPVCFFVTYAFALRKSEGFYYGQNDSFWQQSVSTMTKALFGNNDLILRSGIAVYFIFTMLMLAKYISQHFAFSVFRQKAVIFPLLFAGNIMAILLLTYFFKVNYPEDRTGFYLYYFFAGSIFYLTDYYAAKAQYKRIAWVVVPLVLIPVHFVYASNFTQVAVYKEDRIPDRFYKEISVKSEAMPDIATLGSYRGRTLVLAYQNYLNKGNVGKSHDTDYPSLIPDFQVVKTGEFAAWNTYYKVIDHDNVSGYNLLERRHKLKRQTISEQMPSTGGETSNEYFNLAEGSIDTMTQNPLFFEYSMDIESPAAPFVAWIVVSVNDSAGKNLAYEYIPLNWVKPVWTGASKHFHNGQLVTNLNAASVKYLTYIWNINKVPFSVTNAKITVKKLEKD